MDVKLKASKVKGTVIAPASKSVMQRACAAALLRNGITTIYNYGISNDDKAALDIIRQLGATVTYIDDERLTIESPGVPVATAHSVVNCGESGLSFRMFSAIAAMMDVDVTLLGHGSLLQRPVHFIQEILPLLGVTIHADNGMLPLRIKGPLAPKDVLIDGSITSQLLTGLLFAYSKSLTEDVAVTVENLKSKPYIDLTLKVMEDFGMNVPINNNYGIFTFKYKGISNDIKTPLKYTVESDWSNAAFFMVAGAIAGSVTIKGLDVFTTQADKKILEALQDCGCRLSIQMDQIEIAHQPLKAFHFDATDCPDLFPPLVALAANCSGTSVIEGVHRLKHKESNRAIALKQEFEKLGVSIQIQDDKMIIQKNASIDEPVSVNGHNDHRIVMAAAIASLTIANEVTITGSEAVNKSFPKFFEMLDNIRY